MNRKNQPDFIIIGAQKSGTTWLWEILKQHPETDLRVDKEIWFFGSSERLSLGLDWYLRKFQHLDDSKIIGEASTDYFFDFVTREDGSIDETYPSIPELILDALPEVKIILVLRDPVARTISAYYHHMRRRRYSPFIELREADSQNPHLRIVEFGCYARFHRLWKEHVPNENILCLVFEEDIIHYPRQTIQKVYEFLGLTTPFMPKSLDKVINERWGWIHIILNYISTYSNETIIVLCIILTMFTLFNLKIKFNINNMITIFIFMFALLRLLTQLFFNI